MLIIQISAVHAFSDRSSSTYAVLPRLAAKSAEGT
jgi:hypothetical protein